MTNNTNRTPVTCLGLSFENDTARCNYFLEQLREQLQVNDFIKQDGFPHVNDAESILALSDPPYYTACPNPWLSDFIKEWTTENQTTYRREPFAADVTEGKNDPIYNAHAYHTKVPHKAIMRYILHYTQPGDIVYDGFSGSGMTGVAAQLCGDKRTIETLGYRVHPDGRIDAPELDENGNKIWKPFSQLGARRAILNDLSPIATFIAYNYNIPANVIAFEQEARKILQLVEAECGWMYQTLHSSTKNIEENSAEIKSVILGETDCPAWLTIGRINYTIWSDVFLCPECTNEVIYWQAAQNQNDQFPCPHCDALLIKRKLEKVWQMQIDKALGKTIKQAKQIPVLINYSVGNQRFQKQPDQFDQILLEKIETSEIPHWFPINALPEGYNTSQPKKSHGFTHVHHFYSKRNLWVFSALLAQINKYTDNRRLLNYLKIWLTSSHSRLHKLNRYAIQHKRHVGPLSNTLYISSTPAEISPLNFINSKIKDNIIHFDKQSISCITTGTASHTQIADNSIDYIFLDPPFGANIMYSEMNYLWESWLQVFTNNQPEAIVNKKQGKELKEYRQLMGACFKEAFRILKPAHWMTIEFNNTQARVWNTIQISLQDAGFVISSVDILNKGRGGLHAITGTTAAKQDLIISAYKPSGDLEQKFEKIGGSEEGLWEFVRNHLSYLPVTKIRQGKLEFLSERDPRILYDRAIAYFIGHGYFIPLSSQEFQAGLRAYFKESDGMIFLPEQFVEYEHKRKHAKTPPQLELFICDERSAIDWLHQFLKKRPSTRQDIQPEFTKRLGAGWKKYEILPELDTLLEYNFLKYNKNEPVPSQIHSYLSSSYKDCRNLEKEDPHLQERAQDRWYVPDPHQAQDLEKLREAHLLREFKHYLEIESKPLKSFRLEALRAGFKKAWAKQNYQLIVDMADKLPESALYEDEKLLQLYDLAIVRLEGV